EEEVVLTKTTLSTPGENSFSASINWAEDMRVENNTLEKSVYVATQACGYTVHLVDAWGDGWDGIIGFKQNGELIGTFGEGFTSGKTFGPVTIDLWDGLETQIVVVHPEEYSEEVGFTVLDRLGEVVYHRDPGEEFDADFVFHTFIATCELPENDARAVSIDVPTFIGLGIPTNIQGTVQNLSSSEKTFEATLFIFDETDVQKFETTVEVTFSSLESGTIDFGEWTPIEEGSYSLELSVILASDENSENNTLEKLVYVATHACGYTVHLVDDYGDGWDGTIGFMQNGLLAGTFGEGFTSGKTFGPVTIDLWEGLETQIVVVDPEYYSEEVGFTVLDRLGEVVYHRDPGEEFDADFVFHTFIATCELPENDARAVSIDMPNFIRGDIPTSIQGTVTNFSNSEKTFEATLSVFDETSVEKFTATIEVTLSSVESKTINFGEWTTIEEGSYYAELTVFLIDDEEPDNDSVSKDFFAVNRLLWGDNGYLEGSSNDIPSVNLGGIDNGLIETADDFILPVGSWEISTIMVAGNQIEGVLSGYLVRIYADAEGVPGEIIHEEIVETTEDFFIELNFSEPIVLEGGHYWLMVAGHFPDASSIYEVLWVWKTWNKIIEHKFMIRDNPNISGIGTSSWIDPQFLGIQEGGSTIFWIFGEEMRVNLDVVADPVGMGWVNGEESLFMEVQAGTQTTLTATPATGYQFINWTDADGNTISTEAAFDYTLPTNDVVLTANFGVITSLNNRKETELLILPNPFDIEIIIKGGTNIKQINIANVLGKIIFKIGHPVSNIQTSHFSPGVYILTIEENNGQVSKYKLVKK
ncbi:MAG TPA: T9SS type A sorting domain-containing protein, partial [Marinilabiliaceae bacterium]|nr:T9SS type A sorting domain-containing protein [Marinilabiliaceae bacterium]